MKSNHICRATASRAPANGLRKLAASRRFGSSAVFHGKSQLPGRASKATHVFLPRAVLQRGEEFASEPTVRDIPTGSVLAVVLGGGPGTNLFPLTKRRSEPAISFAGSYRLIDIPMSNCVNSGIKKVYVLTQFNSQSLNRHISLAYKAGSFQPNSFIEVLAAQQTQNDKTWFRGTADAIRQFVWLLEDSQNRSVEHVVILAADQIYRMDYMGMVQDHVQSGADLTIACTGVSVTPSRASRLGLMRLSEDGWVTDFVEKPKGSEVERFAVGGGQEGGVRGSSRGISRVVEYTEEGDTAVTSATATLTAAAASSSTYTTNGSTGKGFTTNGITNGNANGNGNTNGNANGVAARGNGGTHGNGASGVYSSSNGSGRDSAYAGAAAAYPGAVATTSTQQQQEENEEEYSYTASMGLYVFNKDLLVRLLKDEYADAADFARDVLPNMFAQGYKVRGHMHHGYWVDLGNSIQDFFEANLQIAQDDNTFNLFDPAFPMYTSQRYLPPAKLINARLTDAMVGNGSILDTCVVDSAVVGHRVRIGKNCVIRDAIVHGCDFYESKVMREEILKTGRVPAGIGPNTTITNTIVDKNCRVGANCQLINKDGVHEMDRPEEGLYIRDGILIVTKGTEVPNGTVI